MSDPDSSDRLDRYFTEQMVGARLQATMGPSQHRPSGAPHGVVLDLPGGRAELFGLAARSLATADPLQALAGRPFELPALLRARSALAALAWSALVLGLMGTGAALMWLALPWLPR